MDECLTPLPPRDRADHINTDAVKHLFHNDPAGAALHSISIFGVPIGTRLPPTTAHGLDARNHGSYRRYHVGVDASTAKEAAAGRFVGPLAQPLHTGPIIVSPLAAVPRKGEPDRPRKITDLSWGGERSANHNSNYDALPKMFLPTVNDVCNIVDAVKRTQLRGNPVFISRSDASTAYRAWKTDMKQRRYAYVRTLDGRDDQAEIAAIRDEVRTLCGKFAPYPG